MRWARVIVVLGGASLVAACLLPELGDLGGAGQEDGSTAGDATGDAPTKLDGGGDALSDAPATDGSASFCPDGSFCDDFDNGALGAKWTSTLLADGVLALETGGVSAPNLLRASLVPPVGTERRAGLSKTFNVASGPKRVVCAVSAKVVTRPTTPGEDVQLLEVYEKGTTYDDLYVKIQAGGTYLLEEFNAPDGGAASASKSLSTASGGIAVGVWTRLTLDVNFATKAATLTIAPSGGSTSTITMPAITPGVSVKSYELNLAEPADHETDPSTIQYDDFRCDITP